jgi:hypothetical protein
MARPQKNNLDYFSHDCDMRNDIKIKALRRKFGHKGYSIYLMMLEHLGDCQYLQYEWDDLSIELLTPDFDIDGDELKNIIDYCVFLKLFELELGILYCPKLFERNKKLITDRSSYSAENSPLNKLKRDLLSKSGENPSLSKESTQSKVKESKLNQTKLEESKLNQTKLEESIPNEMIEEFELEEMQRSIMLDELEKDEVKEEVKVQVEVEVIDKLLEIKRRIDNGEWNRLSPKEARYWYDNNHLINDLVIQ